MSFIEQYNSSVSPSAKRIAEYLMKQVDLKDLLENENKSLSHMYHWICQQVKEKIGTQNEYIAEDQEVYDLAVMYYKDETIIIEQQKAVAKEVKPTKPKQIHVKADRKNQLSIFDLFEDE